MHQNYQHYPQFIIKGFSIIFMTFYSCLLANETDFIHQDIASKASAQQIAEEIDQMDEIIAWQSSSNESQTSIKVITKNELNFSYSHKLPSPKLVFITLAHQKAMEKFKKTLKNRGQLSKKSSSVLKVWTQKGGEHDHAEGTNVWTKITYSSKDDQQATFFIVCHRHGQDTEIFCHYREHGVAEPEI